MQSIDSIETYAYGTSKDLASEREVIKCSRLIKRYKKWLTLMMLSKIKENIKEHNPNWAQISDHPYGTLIIGGSGSGKTNSLFNLINQQPDIYKIYLYAKDQFETKYKFLINKRESTDLKHFNDSKAINWILKWYE